MAWAERRGLILSGVAAGIAHGAINSLGRFLLLRAAIKAVVNEAPFRVRAGLAVTN